MLPAANRLTKKRDFDLVLKHGRWVREELLAVKVLDLAKNKIYFPKKEDPEKFEKQLRIAIAVGLKVSKRAVERNRLKRQMREVVRILLQKNEIREGIFALIVPQPNFKEKSYAEISEKIKLIFERGNLLK